MEIFLPNEWINWCRLCAADGKQHINLLYLNEDHLKNEMKSISIHEALDKYFGVQASPEDSYPKMICSKCLFLVSSMINFSERIVRVQEMYSYLTETQSSTKSLDLDAVRIKFDIRELQKDHSFNKFSFYERENKCSNSTFNTNIKQHLTDDKFNVPIKLENVEKPADILNNRYRKEGEDLEKEEILFEQTACDSLVENESDPFQHNDAKEKSSAEEDNPETLIQTPSRRDKSKYKVDRSKKKRKLLKKFSALDCKKKKNAIKDFKMESTCNECGENFSKYILYREHMQEEHNHSRSEKHWPCPVCDKVLLSIYNLERHVRIHVPLEIRKTVKCTECDDRYTSNAQLETHIRYKHKNEKPFICEECGLCLRTNSNLRQHMLIHTDAKPFECDVCKKRFKNKTRLKTHMDIHSPNKHMCNICGFQLNSRATLNRHFLVHSDEMQHKCDYCGKAFKRAKALKNHLLLHTGLKPYTCDFCERTFANGSNCRSHMKKMHPGELAALEASGTKAYTKNIPKLETLKAVTKAADNLTPVVTKLSGCFAFGRKPTHLDTNHVKQLQKSQRKSRKAINNENDVENLSMVSPSSTPLDLQYVPLVGNNMNSACLAGAKNAENIAPASTSAIATPIPNFDNIYQHLMKQNQTDPQLKRPLPQMSPQASASNVVTPHNSNSFYHDMTHSLKVSLENDDDELLHSPGSQHSTMPLLSHEDHANAALIQGSFYGAMRTTLPPGNFI